MFDVTVHCNSTTGERYTSTSLRGYQLLEQPFFNKGTAFTQEERAELKLEGLLPPAVTTIDAQLNRAYEEFNNKNTPLEKHIYLNSLHDRNETLFFRLLQTHITEMLPLVYTPVVGEAFSGPRDGRSLPLVVPSPMSATRERPTPLLNAITRSFSRHWEWLRSQPFPKTSQMKCFMSPLKP